MNGFLVDSIGMTGAVLTTVCWLPQAIQIVRSRDTAAISLSGTLAFTIGIAFWLIYGLALMDWPLITSNVVTLALMSVIVALAAARVKNRGRGTRRRRPRRGFPDLGIARNGTFTRKPSMDVSCSARSSRRIGRIAKPMRGSKQAGA